MHDKLFYVDEGEASTARFVPELDDLDRSGFDELPSESEELSGDDAAEATPTLTSSSTFIPPNGRKAPAWTDPDDTTLQVSLASDNRLRKLRDAPSEDSVGGREYERRLRRQYEKINPTPTWADKFRKRLHPTRAKRRRSSSSGSEVEDQDEDSVHDLFNSTTGILGTLIRSRTLPKGTLAIERLRDANQAAQSEGEVKTVRFHPSPQVPVLMTASADRRVRLFNVSYATSRCSGPSHGFIRSRSTATQILYSKPCTFPPFLSLPPISIQRAPLFYLLGRAHSTIPMIYRPGRLNDPREAFGVPLSIAPTHKLKTLAWRSALSIPPEIY